MIRKISDISCKLSVSIMKKINQLTKILIFISLIVSNFYTYTFGEIISPNLIIGGLNTPYGVVVDSSGNIYVVDTGNNKMNNKSKVGIFFPFPTQEEVKKYATIPMKETKDKIENLITLFLREKWDGDNIQKNLLKITGKKESKDYFCTTYKRNKYNFEILVFNIDSENVEVMGRIQSSEGFNLSLNRLEHLSKMFFKLPKSYKKKLDKSKKLEGTLYYAQPCIFGYIDNYSFSITYLNETNSIYWRFLRIEKNK